MEIGDPGMGVECTEEQSDLGAGVCTARIAHLNQACVESCNTREN